jgi:hypothetical protein
MRGLTKEVQGQVMYSQFCEDSTQGVHFYALGDAGVFHEAPEFVTGDGRFSNLHVNPLPSLTYTALQIPPGKTPAVSECLPAEGDVLCCTIPFAAGEKFPHQV